MGSALEGADGALPGPVATTLRERDFDRWREVVRSAFLALECRADAGTAFDSSVLLRRVGDSTAADIGVTASRVRRARRDAENDACPCFKVFWQLAGHSLVRQGRGEATLAAGSWTVYDTSREYAIESSARSRFLVLLVPQAQAPHWVAPVRELAGSAIADAGASHIARATLSSLLRDETPPDPATQQIVGSSTLALLDRAMWGELERRGIADPGVDRPSLARIQAYVAEHLGDPRLTPESVAEAFGIGRRTLYALFDGSGLTPRACIQQARLQRAGALLRQAGWREAPIGRIAQHCGFADAATFSRAFHAHHGVAPSAWRVGGGVGSVIELLPAAGS